MNSYPIELLVQHAPMMFVAGLDVPPTPSVVPPSNGTASEPTVSLADGNQSLPDSRDPFVVLQSRLKAAFTARRRGSIWDLNKSKHFNVIVVDKVGWDALKL